jgi:hypothetical protein
VFVSVETSRRFMWVGMYVAAALALSFISMALCFIRQSYSLARSEEQEEQGEKPIHTEAE